MSLSKNFRINDVFSRAEQYCQEVELNRVPAMGLLAMIKRKTLSVVTFAGGALNEFYTAEDEFALTAVSGSSGVYKADISALNFYKIQSVSVPFDSFDSLSSGDDGTYSVVKSREAFYRKLRNVEDNQWARWYYLQLGNDQMNIYVAVGDQYSAGLSEIAVTHKRTPDVSFTLNDARDKNTTIYMDLPDFYVMHVEYSAAIDALKQAGVKAGQMQGLIDDHKEVLSQLNGMYQAENDKLGREGADK